jgi:hypothetical protein
VTPATLAFVASSLVDLNAAERAEGNRRADAVQLGRVLLRTIWPAQVLKIRVDGAGRHEVAGLVLSGVKFHRRLDPAGFGAEVAALIRLTFTTLGVEEVDVWATVPLPYVEQTPVNGEYLQPTERIVFGATVPRSDAAAFGARLRRGDDVFWDPVWRSSLGRTQGGARGKAQS